MPALADPPTMSLDPEDLEHAAGRRTADDHARSLGRLGLDAVGAQLATLNATVAALQGELYRSLNGLEKVTEKGLENVGVRLDKLEARMGEQETAQAVQQARVEALETWRREEEKRQNQEAQQIAGSVGQLQRDSATLATWQILVAAVIGTLGLLGTIAGIVSAVS